MTDLRLNFTPLIFSGASIDFQTLPYRDRDQIADLRKKYVGQFAFLRRDELIYAMPMEASAPPIGAVGRATVDDLFLVRTLVEQRLVSLFAARKRLATGYRPLSFVGRLISPGSDAYGEWIQARTKLLVAPRILELPGSKAMLGLAWDSEVERKLPAPLSRLVELGLDPRGLVVETETVPSDARFAPWRRVAGRVSAVDGDLAVLGERYKDMPERIPLDQIYLEPSPENVRHLSESLIRNQAGTLLQKVARLVEDHSRGAKKMQQVDEISGWLRSVGPITLQPGLSFDLGELLNQRRKPFPQFRSIPAATYVFDSATLKAHTHNAAGLQKFGPYSRNVFTPSRPEICVICDKPRRGQTEEFLRKLKDGLATNQQYPPFAQGMPRLYGLQDIKFTFFEAKNFSTDAYVEASSQAIMARASGSPWSLAIVQTEHASRFLAPALNPYLAAKAAFLSTQIPTQAVTVETFNMPENQLAYTLSNFALATYAKLGGVPWLIKSDTSIAHEIVIGLGSASIGESRFSRRERLVGITSVFRGDGGYLLSNLSQAVPFDKYQSTLTESLRATLERVRAEMNWIPGDSVRVVVHAFKPMRDTEVQAVKDCVASIEGFDVTFAFLHVKQDHPWLLFDQASTGSSSGKGEKAPQRGLFAELGTHDALCTLVGPKELKRPSDGLPRPVLLSLHRDSTFTDMVYLTKQVFWFSSHSWRSFLPASMPVTILYSELVAGLLGRLSKLGSRWSSSVMLGRVGTTRWFL